MEDEYSSSQYSYRHSQRNEDQVVECSSEIPHYLEEMEWLPMFSIPPQTTKNLETDTVVSSLKEKVSALLDLKSLHPDAKKKCRWVFDELESLGSFLKDACKSKDLSSSDKAMVWMEKLSGASHSAMAVIDDFINKYTEQETRSWTVSTSFSRLESYKLSKEMEELYDKLLNLSISRPVNKYSRERPESESMGSDLTGFNDEELDFAGFADDVHAMTRRLLAGDNSFRVIPIMGMQGIGKTALAKLTFNNKAVVDHFPCRAWPSSTSTASSTRDPSDQILIDTIKQLINYEIKEDYIHYTMLQKLLKSFFISFKSLIVMDDPAHFHHWHELLEALTDTSSGSRMVCITQKMSIPPVLKMMSIDPHPLRLRSDLESWALFTHALNTLKVSMPSQSVLQKLKQRILTTCGGLPLLIMKLAQALSVSLKDSTINGEEDWSAALQQLLQIRDEVWSNTPQRIYKQLSLSMRRYLFSLTLFPPNYDIPVRRLTTSWVVEDDYLLMQMAEGTPSNHNEARPEDVTERCLDMLIVQGMVQVATKKLNGNVKTVRLPDAVARYWLSKAQQLVDHHRARANYTRSELFPTVGNSMIRRLVDHIDTNDITFDHIHRGGQNKTISSASLRQYYQDVISFRSFDSQERVRPVEYIGDFIGRCISSKCLLSLQVLDLENVFRPKLPEVALGQLTQLRYLGLRSTFIEKLPSSIKKLRNLQTLDIKHTNVRILLDSVLELQKLRHLYLSEGYTRKILLKSCRSRLGCLTTLHTLSGLFVDKKTPVRNSLNKLLNLRKLGVTMSSQVKVVGEWVLNLKHLQSLRLKSIGGGDDEYELLGDLELMPLTCLMNLSCLYLYGQLRNPSIIVSQFPPSLVDITLSGSGLTEDPMQSLDKLPNLKCLKLYAKSYVGKSMHCSRGGFPELRVLKLWKLDQLQEWKVEEGALQALRDLEIRYSSRRPSVPEELSNRSPFLKIDILQLSQ